MKRKDILQRLEERLARGEISEKTYLDIKARYEAEPEEPSSEVPPDLGPDFAETISAAQQQAARAAAGAAKVAEDVTRAVGEALSGVDFSGFGTKFSEDSVKIVGSGSVTGNPVQTREFKVAGSARVQGDLRADVAKISGSCQFDGSVMVDTFRASGGVRIAGSLEADDVESSGSLQVAGDVRSDDLQLSGSFRTGGRVECDDFRSAGALWVEGELHADDVSIHLAGESFVRSIAADDVDIRVTGGLLRSRGSLKAERIVAQDVYLEGVEADYVEGHDVRVGPHCRIGTVRAEDLVVHQSSEVRERTPRGTPSPPPAPPAPPPPAAPPP